MHFKDKPAHLLKGVSAGVNRDALLNSSSNRAVFLNHMAKTNTNKSRQMVRQRTDECHPGLYKIIL